ncbi:MAG: phosphate acetyltransferase, partial [Clostridiaceae bacterium]|nr:phosphate acetyltransferase [Clostridiaceae bacterium]
ERARRTKRRMALPETDDRILQAARKAKDLGIIEPVLLGDPEELRERAAGLDINFDDIEIINYPDEALFQQVAEEYAAVKDDFSVKGIIRKMKDRVSAAMILLVAGRVDCVMAGISHSTAEVVLAGQMFVGTQPGINTISSMGVMDIPGWQGSEGQLLAFSDSAVNADPDASELADIAITTADTMHRLFDWEPRVALLSFSTKGSTEHPQVDKVRSALEIARKRRPELKIDGEFQLDAAILPEIAARKVKEPSDVAGKANIIIYPNLTAGNIGVKLVQIFGNANAYGPMLQGFAKSIGDFSRSAPIDEMVGNMAMVALNVE